MIKLHSQHGVQIRQRHHPGVIDGNAERRFQPGG